MSLSNTLKKLLTQLSPRAKPVQPDRPCPDTTVAVVGDIHGRADLLVGLVDKIDALAPHAAKVFVGDYVDRGPSSREVLEYLQGLPGEVVCLLGNHEAMMLGFVESPIENGARWLRNGGLATLASYGIRLGENASHGEIASARDSLSLELQGATMRWLKARPLWWKSGNLLVSHAGADPRLPISGQADGNFLWGHKRFLRDPREDGLWVAHGHWARERPAVRDARISVDTGAWKTGRLTAALIEPAGKVRFVHHRA